MDKKIAALCAACLLTACGPGAGSGGDAKGQAAGGPQSADQAQQASAKPGLFASPQKDCEAPKTQPSKTREEAGKVVDGCLAVLAKNADEDGESAWNKSQLAAAEKGDPTAQFLSALAAFAHPDGSLRKVDGMERVEAFNRLDAAAGGGYAMEVYELGKRWGKDRRRAETAEEQHAMYLGEDLFRVAAMHEIYPAMIERARLEIYFGVNDEKSFNSESASQHFYDAAKLLKIVQEKGSAREQQTAGALLKEVRY